MIPVHLTQDPTWVKADIDANPIWKLAWEMSEVDNDNAPIGWGTYIPLARWVLDNYVRNERG